jgi:hypothetical protein
MVGREERSMDADRNDGRRMMRVVDAAALDGFRVLLAFDDGATKTVDVGPFLTGDGSMVRPLREDQALFKAARAEDGTVVWPNGFDLDPDVLYYDDLRAEALAQIHPVPAR